MNSICKMMPRGCDVATLAVILFLIGNVVHHCDSVTSMESESHVRPKMYCEFYNKTCAKSIQLGLDDGCSDRQECVQEDGKQNNHCFVVWKEEEGNVSVELKGCIFTNEDCNNTKCVETREPTKKYLYCCCKGYMCNRNFTWEPQPKPPPLVLKEPEPVTKPATLTLIQWVIYLAVPVVIFAAVIFAWFFRRNKHMFNELPTTDQNPIAPPSPLIGQSCIQLIEVKARGRFGAVWKAQLKSEEVAVKIFPIQDKQSWVQEKQIFQLPNMEHPNILHFIGVEKRGDNLQAEFWLITAYHDKGSLCDYLKAHTLTFPILCKVVETMARGLMHLHEEIPGKHGEPLKPSIAHRDFKSKNVLLKNDMTACIADFGLALVFESGKSCGDTHGQVGTRRYMAPEVLEGAINFTPDAFLRIDMYACGLVLWELVSRCTAQGGIIPEYRLPFEEEVGQHPSLEDMQEAVVQRKVRPTIPEMWRSNPGLVSLCETMEECWDHDAEARLSASCVMERVLNQSKYQHSSLSMRIENEAPRSPFKENSM